MRLALLILLFAFSAQAQLLTTGLKAFWRADANVQTATIPLKYDTATVGVTNWYDVSAGYIGGTVTSVWTQASSANASNAMPPYVTDFEGNKCVEFPWAFGADHPSNFLTCASFTGISSQSLAIFAVISEDNAREAQSLIYAPGWGFSLLGLANVQFTSFGISSNWAPVNKSIVMVNNSSSNCFARVNNLRQAMSAVGNTALTGIELGGYTAAQRFSGRVYAILIYSQPLWPSQEDQVVSWLANEFKVITNYTKNVGCQGDSKTAGIGATNNLAYPTQLAQQMPEVQFFNFGLGGQRMSTNGVGGGMYDEARSYVDQTWRVGYTNNIFLEANYNDLANSVTAEGCYGQTTNYASARRNTNWTSVVVATLGNGSPTTITNYNANIRTRTPFKFYTDVSDSGVGSPTETRLSDPNNSTYFYDGTHYVNAGYTVLKEHFATFVNQHRRATGFFSQ